MILCSIMYHYKILLLSLVVAKKQSPDGKRNIIICILMKCEISTKIVLYMPTIQCSLIANQIVECC